jgi:hypothetical protein
VKHRISPANSILRIVERNVERLRNRLKECCCNQKMSY